MHRLHAVENTGARIATGCQLCRPLPAVALLVPVALYGDLLQRCCRGPSVMVPWSTAFLLLYCCRGIGSSFPPSPVWRLSPCNSANLLQMVLLLYMLFSGLNWFPGPTTGPPRSLFGSPRRRGRLASFHMSTPGDIDESDGATERFPRGSSHQMSATTRWGLFPPAALRTSRTVPPCSHHMRSRCDLGISNVQGGPLCRRPTMSGVIQSILLTSVNQNVRANWHPSVREADLLYQHLIAALPYLAEYLFLQHRDQSRPGTSSRCTSAGSCIDSSPVATT